MTWKTKAEIPTPKIPEGPVAIPDLLILLCLDPCCAESDFGGTDHPVKSPNPDRESYRSSPPVMEDHPHTSLLQEYIR